jgi:2-oxoglutarate ferredoxin oxidoreductase subunit gamma
MKEYLQIILGGEGGQGLVLAGVILGEAAMLEDRQAAQTAAYGIASRGGFAKSEVIISDTDIEYPGVEEPDLVLALSQEAVDKYLGRVAPGCLLVYDYSTIMAEDKGDNVIGLPLTETITAYKNEKGTELPLNILSLGALAGLAGIVEIDSLLQIVTRRFPKSSQQNQNALTAGFALGKASRQRREAGQEGYL